MRDSIAASALAALGAVLCFAGAPTTARGGGETTDRPAPDVRLVHLLDGLRPMAPGDDPARVGETKTAKDAARYGLDLAKPANPLIAHAWSGGRLWYVFYKVTENAFGDRPYVIQRIRKTERTWAADDTKTPEEKVTYQVEVFKTMAGTLKQPDQHHGDFGHQDAARREIVKEYEIGFGEVPGACEGRAWPFEAGTLFRMLQAYQTEAGLWDRVAFTAARKWSLTVTLGRDGRYSIVSPELGLDVPRTVPDAKLADPRPVEASKEIVLTPGTGPKGLTLGTSTPEDAAKTLGEPVETTAAGTKGNVNHSFRAAVTCNFDASGRLNTVITRAGFLGRTSNGVAHGMSRAKVMELLGAPKGQRADAVQWTFPGMLVSFDGFDRVARIVVARI